MLATPGVYFEYVDRGRPAATLLRTDVAAFLGYTERGPLLTPVRLTNWRQFEAIFGAPLPYAYLGEAVRGFFSNGGAACYVARVADADEAAAASLTLGGGDGQPALKLTTSHGQVADPQTGMPLRESDRPKRFPSPGVWGNRITVSLLPATTGATSTSLPQPETGELSYLETVSGFDAGTVVRFIQDGVEAPAYRRIVGVTAHLLQVEWDTPITGLGLDLQRPVEVEPVAFTLNIAFDGQIVETHANLTLSPVHDQFVVTRLQTDSLLLDAALTDNWPLALEDRQIEMRSPGRWPIDVADAPLNGGQDGLAGVTADDFLAALASLADVIEISMLAAPDIVLQALPEAAARLPARSVDCARLDPLPTGRLSGSVINSEGAPVRGVRVQPVGVNVRAVNTLADGGFSFENLPLAQITLRLERDGYMPLETTAQARQTVTDPLLITLNAITTPPALSADDIATIQAAMARQGAAGGYRVAILDAPESQLTIDGIQNWRQRFDTSYAALYYPWLVTDTPSGTRHVPPSGHVAGLIARTDLNHGPHRAPANFLLDGAHALSHPVGDVEQGLLNQKGINCLRVLPGRGLRVFGARTTSSEAEWRYVNVRRLMLMIEKALERSTRWAVFEPNNLLTRQALVFSIGQFLTTLWRQGALAGDTPAAAYRLRCDESNNPEDVVAAGQLVMDIAVAPAIPFEFIRFRLGRTVDAITITE